MDSARVRTCLDGVCVPCAQRAPRRGKREGFDACLTFTPMAAPPAVLIGIQADTTVAVRTGTGGGARCWEDRV